MLKILIYIYYKNNLFYMYFIDIYCRDNLFYTYFIDIYYSDIFCIENPQRSTAVEILKGNSFINLQRLVSHVPNRKPVVHINLACRNNFLLVFVFFF